MPKKSPQPQADQPDLDRVAQLESEAAELRAGWQRCQADFENFRRRAQDERATLGSTMAAQTLIELVPVYDNFQRAFAHVKDEHSSWADGFRHIAKQMEDVFTSHGLVRISTVGAPFDPTQHEAVSELPHPTYPADTVAEELESGWQHNGRIIKPAKVVVSTGSGEEKGA